MDYRPPYGLYQPLPARPDPHTIKHLPPPPLPPFRPRARRASLASIAVPGPRLSSSAAGMSLSDPRAAGSGSADPNTTTTMRVADDDASAAAAGPLILHSATTHDLHPYFSEPLRPLTDAVIALHAVESAADVPHDLPVYATQAAHLRHALVATLAAWSVGDFGMRTGKYRAEPWESFSAVFEGDVRKVADRARRDVAVIEARCRRHRALVDEHREAARRAEELAVESHRARVAAHQMQDGGVIWGTTVHRDESEQRQIAAAAASETADEQVVTLVKDDDGAAAAAEPAQDDANAEDDEHPISFSDWAKALPLHADGAIVGDTMIVAPAAESEPEPASESAASDSAAAVAAAAAPRTEEAAVVDDDAHSGSMILSDHDVVDEPAAHATVETEAEAAPEPAEPATTPSNASIHALLRDRHMSASPMPASIKSPAPSIAPPASEAETAGPTATEHNQVAISGPTAVAAPTTTTITTPATAPATAPAPPAQPDLSTANYLRERMTHHEVQLRSDLRLRSLLDTMDVAASHVLARYAAERDLVRTTFDLERYRARLEDVLWNMYVSTSQNATQQVMAFGGNPQGPQQQYAGPPMQMPPPPPVVPSRPLSAVAAANAPPVPHMYAAAPYASAAAAVYGMPQHSVSMPNLSAAAPAAAAASLPSRIPKLTRVPSIGNLGGGAAQQKRARGAGGAKSVDRSSQRNRRPQWSDDAVFAAGEDDGDDFDETTYGDYDDEYQHHHHHHELLGDLAEEEDDDGLRGASDVGDDDDEDGYHSHSEELDESDEVYLNRSQLNEPEPPRSKVIRGGRAAVAANTSVVSTASGRQRPAPNPASTAAQRPPRQTRAPPASARVGSRNNAAWNVSDSDITVSSRRNTPTSGSTGASRSVGRGGVPSTPPTRTVTGPPASAVRSPPNAGATRGRPGPAPRRSGTTSRGAASAAGDTSVLSSRGGTGARDGSPSPNRPLQRRTPTFSGSSSRPMSMPTGSMHVAPSGGTGGVPFFPPFIPPGNLGLNGDDLAKQKFYNRMSSYYQSQEKLERQIQERQAVYEAQYATGAGAAAGSSSGAAAAAGRAE
ncbi:hypothetical protein H9P43_005734 [Blastocladiella emersonii ATCC 22665]|nr:hypothetical protein H9P43_005734 [Blastocladiella emersonii ATCC 22665]